MLSAYASALDVTEKDASPVAWPDPACSAIVTGTPSTRRLARSNGCGKKRAFADEEQITG